MCVYTHSSFRITLCVVYLLILVLVGRTGRKSKFPVPGDTTFSAHFLRHMVFPEMSGNRKCTVECKISYSLSFICPEKHPKIQDRSRKCCRKFCTILCFRKFRIFPSAHAPRSVGDCVFDMCACSDRLIQDMFFKSVHPLNQFVSCYSGFV